MRKFLVSLFVAGSFLIAPLAHAEMVSGIVDFIDTESGLLMLQDGSEFMMADDLDASGIDAGSAVSIDYDLVDDTKVINSISTDN